ncbi:MAG: DUF362 domain-containing protein [Candidatus Thorarchaeota archaeon]
MSHDVFRGPIYLRMIRMVKPIVFFSDRNTSAHYNMLDKLEEIFIKLGLPESINSGDRVMIKTHLGLWGNTNHIRPVYVRKLVDLVRAAGGIPFVADTCGLGYGSDRPYGGRTTAPDYLERAEMNGFTQGVVGAPIVLIDGFWGVDTHSVSIDGKYLSKVAVASATLDCDKVILLSHSKFHHIGLASTLKNMGVGMVGKPGKTAIHSEQGLEIYPEKCKGVECSECVTVCPRRCITVIDTVSVDMEQCVQCGHCSSICSGKVKAGALKVTWSGVNMAEKIVENTLGVLDSIGRERFYFFNLALDISDMCDCVCYGAPLLMHDIGIFGSQDPVAIDHATMETMRDVPRNTEAISSEKVDSLIEKSILFFNHGSKLGIGSTEYDLVDLSRKTE